MPGLLGIWAATSAIWGQEPAFLLHLLLPHAYVLTVPHSILYIASKYVSWFELLRKVWTFQGLSLKNSKTFRLGGGLILPPIVYWIQIQSRSMLPQTQRWEAKGKADHYIRLGIYSPEIHFYLTSQPQSLALNPPKISCHLGKVSSKQTTFTNWFCNHQVEGRGQAWLITLDPF